MFSLLGSDRSARAASEASSATSGFSACRASSRLRKSTGVFRSNGTPFSLSLMSAPSRLVRSGGSSSQLAVLVDALEPREALHALGVGQQLGEQALGRGAFV